ncbi:hypothetical protein DTL42_08935 [Bremerella cremea]|uniref:Uncharacterized protein n=1 Tax=Bremerella cremea TaxID=1031537 RepID=A0A368KVM2_9BACT|nr:hypothetical protein [Bremerella cremea]RCS52932.1 hypothetical protein DTL42_08935 [Bremerella cremea]
MKLVTLLSSIIVLWCLLGAIVLGPGILVYPATWCAVAGVMYGIHKFLGLGKAPLATEGNSRSDSDDHHSSSDLPSSSPTAIAR